ncbi:MAG: alanine:cation symporter family protein [Hungatella hathewayi]
MVGQILKSAPAPEALLGGVGGYGISRSLRHGIARGVFSNEAGLGVPGHSPTGRRRTRRRRRKHVGHVRGIFRHGHHLYPGLRW